MKSLILIITLIISINMNAQVIKGEKITAKKFNGSTHHIGDVKSSFLPLAKFQLLAGDCWVEINGQSVANTDYGNFSENDNLPNGEGRFFRNAGGSAAPLGDTQEDAIRNIIGQFNSGQYPGYSEYSGPFRYKRADSYGFDNKNNSSLLEFDASRALPTGATTDPITGEYRPKSITLNYFIKINNDCN